MEKYDNKLLRSTQFPYHLTNPPKLTKLSKPGSLKKLDNIRYSDVPTTYMVVNFDEQFTESLPSEMPPIVKVDERKTKEILAKLKKHSPQKPEKMKAPKLVTSYVLPKKIDPEVAAAERLMFRRNDVGTQTDLNMNKMVFEGLPGYQAWTADVVEPFIKELRKEVKAKRPQDVASYIIRYCQAMQKGEPAPETVDEIKP